MTNQTKIKLFVYMIISSICFTWMVTPQSSGLGNLCFALVQLGMIFYLCKSELTVNTKGMWLFVPIIVLSASSFVRANDMWRVPNFWVIIFLYSLMAVIMNEGVCSNLLHKGAEGMLSAFRWCYIPFKWLTQIGGRNMQLFTRVAIGLLAAVPAVIILLLLLSSADSVFAKLLEGVGEWAMESLNFVMVSKILAGIFAGTFLFGVMCNVYERRVVETAKKTRTINADIVIFSSIMTCILLVYSVFVFIQFKYLFALSQLPDGLDYVHYARRGFFELFFLTGVNITLIILSGKLFGKRTGKMARITKIFSYYLTALTFVLLLSSAFRMYLYCDDDGFTRLRLLVLGFLLFEAIGLVLTLYYIKKPDFNIIRSYVIIAFTYYLVINMVNIDGMIAKEQIDRYLRGGRDTIDYVLTLSPDAAGQVVRLINDPDASEDVQKQAKQFIIRTKYVNTQYVPRWQRFNLSVNNGINLSDSLGYKTYEYSHLSGAYR